MRGRDKNWSVDEEKELRRLVKTGLRYKQVAEKLGRSHLAVKLRARRLGIDSPFATPKLTIDWTAQPLGKMPDGRLAKLLGCNGVTILYARRRMGIEPFRRPLPRVDASALPLGKMTDREVAEKHRCTLSQVIRLRAKLGIAAFGKREKDYLSTKEGRAVQRLCTRLNDKQVARVIGCTSGTVLKIRKRLGLASGYKTNQQKKQSRMRRLFGTASDTAIARKVGMSKDAVQQNRAKAGITSHRSTVEKTWSESESADLVAKRRAGRTLRQLAAEHKCRYGSVQRELHKRAVCIRRKAFLELREWPLGEVSDALLAELSGYTKGQVQEARVKLGIPAWREALTVKTISEEEYGVENIKRVARRNAGLIQEAPHRENHRQPSAGRGGLLQRHGETFVRRGRAREGDRAARRG